MTGASQDVQGHQRFKMFIGGDWVEGSSEALLPVYDPSTEEVMAWVPEGRAEDVDRAVTAARSAFDDGPWSQTTAAERGRLLLRLAEKIRQNSAALAELESRNSGKPIVEAEFDIADVATCFEYYGGLANKVLGQVNPVPDNALSFTLREPMGVAGLIVPWNYPLLMAAWKLAPALAAGCSCVLKSSKHTPLTALEIAKWFEEVGLPRGVVNIVTGTGRGVGVPLTAHPGVDKIAFTGSSEVGKTILKSAANSVKRVTMELGGKSPNIFFADADFEAAIDGALFGVFINQGEVCSAGSRILVERSIYGKFVEAMTEKAKRIKLGAPLDRGTKMGPLVSKGSTTVCALIRKLARKRRSWPSGVAVRLRLPKDTMSSRPSSTTLTMVPVSPGRKFLAPLPASFRSKASSRLLRLPTTPPSDWPQLSGRVTYSRPSARSGRFARVSSGSTTCSPHMWKPPGAASSNPDSAASWVPGGWKSTWKPNRFMSI